MASAQFASEINQESDSFFSFELASMQGQFCVSLNKCIRTGFGEMVGLSMNHPRRPPRWLGLIWVQLPSLARDDFSSIIWVIHLLARLDELDVGFSQNAAIRLLQILEDFLVVSPQKIFVADGN